VRRFNDDDDDKNRRMTTTMAGMMRYDGVLCGSTLNAVVSEEIYF
jgi:hypothetical protein